MRPTATLVLAAWLVAGCSYTSTERQSAFGPTYMSSAGSPGIEAPGIKARARRDASGAVNVIGTPFYALFKATACVLSAVIAGPAAGVIALTDRPDKARMRQQLDEGVGENCGGSYVLRG